MRSRNFLLLLLTLALGGLFVFLAAYFTNIDSDYLQACTEEAKICPDGSVVVRGGPNCEFAECPENISPETVKNEPADFQFELAEALRIEIGAPIEEHNAESLMEIFPGLIKWDFGGVEAKQGFYIYHHGALNVETYEGELVTGQERNLTEKGLSDLIENVLWRFDSEDDEGSSTEEIIYRLKNPPVSTNDTEPSEEIIDVPNETSTMWPIRYGEDVGRMEEYRFDCEQKNGIFNECDSACPPGVDACAAVCSMTCTGPADEHRPAVPLDSTFCTPSSRNVEACIEIYQPVCGMVEVQCVTTPCDPLPQTFSNSCHACINENVVSYTEGACGVPKEMECSEWYKEPSIECSEVYDPVCGFIAPDDPLADGYYRTFDNSCFACTGENVVRYLEGLCDNNY